MGLMLAFEVPFLLSAADVIWCHISCISICCGCCNINMSSMPVLDGAPEEMEIDIPLEEVSVCPILMLLWCVSPLIKDNLVSRVECVQSIIFSSM